MTLHRRSFLAVGTAALLATPELVFGNQVPPMLDHILLGCSDLQPGINFVEQHTGVHAAFGGVHPGRGTQNALLSLGTRRYLEIIAPDPQQHTENPLAKGLQALTEPRLVGWAAHLHSNIESFAAKLKQAGIEATGPTPGSRKRPDGKELHWQTLNLKDDARGLLPFFIEWSQDSTHPSEDAPKGCQLLRFEFATPQPAILSKLCSQIGLEVQISQGPTAQLHASLVGPKGKLEISS